MKRKDVIIIAFIFVVFVYLFHPFLNTYFAGDDFFHFQVSRFNDLKEFIGFFGFHSFSERGIAFYRPLSREIIFGLFYKLFGLNHLPFRFLQLILHLSNITLVYIFFKKLFKEKVAVFASFFFAISAVNVGILYYLAGGIHGQIAVLLLFLSFLYFLKEKKVLSFVFFVLALASFEAAIAGLPILLGLQFLKNNNKKLKICNYIKFTPHLIVVGLYLYLNYFEIGFSQGEVQYRPVFYVKSILNTLSWYGLWALGMPEMLVDFVGSGLKLDPRVMRYWGDYYKFIFPAFITSLTLIIYATYKNLKILIDKKFLFLIFWFITGVFVFLFLPVHKKYHYLSVSLPAFWAALGYLALKSSKKIFFGIFVSFFVLNTASVMLGEDTYWARERGRISGSLVRQIQQKYPQFPADTTLFVENDPNYPDISDEWGGSSTQANFILNGSDAVQLLYNDPSIKVKYEDLDDIPTDNFKEIVLKF